ncbi:flagellar hook-length control protein FliK [Xanthomonas medicagonis]|uniref:flagellar hook-length control protein FliK n=1 Tax=Xanthomonas medicagonis TaxID=3160841 RepID=UPI003511E7C1
MNNALSALGGSGRTSLPGGAPDPQGADRGGGQDFARLLGNDSKNAAPKPAPRPAAKPQQPSGKDADAKRPEAEDGTRDPARSAEAGSQAARDTAKSGTPKGSEETKAPAKSAKADDSADQDHEEDAGWPPAGLAGIGLSLLPALGAALPAASAGPLGAAAGLAIGAAGAAAKGIAGLLGGDALASASTDPAATATTAATPSATGASAAVAAGGFGGLLAQVAGATAQAAGAGDAAAPVAALAALATAADKSSDGGSADAGSGTDPINLLAPAGIHAPARAMDTAAPFTGSPTPTPNLHGDAFDEEMGARVSWLADQKIGHAHIKLNPAELGPVEVRLHMSGDQVNASFSSNQADVRQALENSLPRLRDMLGQHGFQLGQADVGQQHQQTSHNAPQGTSAGAGGDTRGEDALTSVGIPSVVLRQRGLLDAYA